MDRTRKLADGIAALCNGAKDEKEFGDGVNISLTRLNVDNYAANKIRIRLNVGTNAISINEEDYTEFLSKLSKKDIQYSRLSDNDVKNLVNLVSVKIDAEKLIRGLMNDLLKEGRSQNIYFNDYDKSHFLCVCLEKIGIEMSETISTIILDIK